MKPNQINVSKGLQLLLLRMMPVFSLRFENINIQRIHNQIDSINHKRKASTGNMLSRITNMEFFQFHQSEIRIVAYCLFVCLLFSSKHSFAGEPDFAPNTRPKNIVFNIGVGYGVSNNPCRDCDNSQSVNGVVIAGSLGYKINKKFKVDFGPSIWIEGNDIFNNSGNGARKPSNKRMLIAFSGYYSPFKNFPLSIKLGGGVGSLTYTEDRNRVQIDSKSVNDTEFMSGLAGTFAVLYTVNLGPSLKIHPSAGFWYTDITTPVPSFDSHTDPAKPSITGDIRVNFQFYF